jgi:UDP-3-O-[3-hydroxymyristoyl] glucosamine N-acyltransferase
LTLSELSEHLAASGLPNEVRGNGVVRLRGCNTLEGAREGELTFLANPKYRELVATTRASAIIMKPDETLAPRVPQIVCDDPYRALTLAVVRIHGYRQHPQWGRDALAQVADSAKLGANPNLAPGVVISADSVIGDNVTCYPGVFVGPRAVLGNDVTLYPNVTIYDECRVGNRVTIHAGTVIGEDGLGYAPVGKKWVKIPQAGNVVVEDDVEIGANCAIDRATLGATRIGSGTKLSDLVAIGHGCQVGSDCMFVAQVGLAGSVTVGRHVTIAGQAGVVGHITIGDDAQVGAQSGVNSSVKSGSIVLGAPAAPVAVARRRYATLQKLPEMKARMRSLEREVAELRRVLEAMQGISSGVVPVVDP